MPPENGAPGETDTEEAIVPTDMNLLTGHFMISLRPTLDLLI